MATTTGRADERRPASAGRPAARHYGSGRWPQAQFFAIVASYWHRERPPAAALAGKLGVGPAITERIYEQLRQEHELDEELDRKLADPRA